MNRNSYKSLYVKSCFNEDKSKFEGIVLSTATAFLVKENEKIFLITNRHVVTGKNVFTGELLDKKTASIPNELIVEFAYEVTRYHNNDKYWGNPFKISLYKDDEINEKNKLWLEHPVYKEKIDVVAIDVTTICKNSIEALYTIGNCKSVNIPLYENILNDNYVPQVTEQVFVVGYPYGYSTTNKKYLPIWSNATIASEYEQNLTLPLDYVVGWEKLFRAMCNETDEIKKVELETKLKKIEYFEAPTFLVDSKTRQGQSGSPVILNNKEDTILLGIYSGRINENSDLGYVWKTELIKEIIGNG